MRVKWSGMRHGRERELDRESSGVRTYERERQTDRQAGREQEREKDNY